MHRFLRCLAPVLLLVGTVFVHAQDALPSTSTFYPLAVGNTWHYKASESRFSIKVAKIEKASDGTPCARLELIINDQTKSSELISVKKNEILRFKFDSNDAKPPVTFLKLPPKAGDSWTVESKVGDAPLKGSFKVAEEKDVKVPAGTFNTFTVTGSDMEANGVKVTVKYYFADKVGMVKQVLETAGQKVEIELERLELK